MWQKMIWHVWKDSNKNQFKDERESKICGISDWPDSLGWLGLLDKSGQYDMDWIQDGQWKNCQQWEIEWWVSQSRWSVQKMQAHLKILMRTVNTQCVSHIFEYLRSLFVWGIIYKVQWKRIPLNIYIGQDLYQALGSYWCTVKAL